jgi:hypothetical protein
MNDLTLYEKYRGEMKTGDCLLYRSNEILGKLIRVFSRGFNHAGLVLRLDEYQGKENRVWTMEALGHGVVLNFLSRKLADYNGEVWWYPLLPVYNDKRQATGEFACIQAGTPYDYGSLFKNIAARVSANARKLFCSELVFLAWRYALIAFGKTAPRPGDIPALGIFKEPIQLF